MDNYALLQNIAVSDNGFMFIPTTGETFTLNKIAKDFINLIKQGKDFHSTLNEFSEKYDVDKNTLEKDFNDFINQLKNFKILELI